MTKLLFDLDLELLTARSTIEKAEAMLAEVCEEYFSNVEANNGHTSQGKENIVSGFEQNRVIAEIARDYAMQTRQTLDTMAAMIKHDTVKVQMGNCECIHFDPIVRLERLGIAATRNGKGHEWIAILEKHGITDYRAFPLSKYRVLEADLAGQ